MLKYLQLIVIWNVNSWRAATKAELLFKLNDCISWGDPRINVFNKLTVKFTNLYSELHSHSYSYLSTFSYSIFFTYLPLFFSFLFAVASFRRQQGWTSAALRNGQVSKYALRRCLYCVFVVVFIVNKYKIFQWEVHLFQWEAHLFWQDGGKRKECSECDCL